MRKVLSYQIIGFVIACLIMLQSQVSVAQWTADVIGTVKKEETKKRLAGVTITIKRNGSVWKILTPEDNGKFEASLLPDAVYMIEVSKAGHVTKRIEVNTKHIPPDDAKYGFDLPMDISLFEKIEGLDVSILDKPIGKMAFDPNTGYMGYDEAYTKSIQKELDRLKKELAERLKQMEADRKLKQKSYDAAISAGDKAFNSEKWAEAKPHYDKAAGIFPNETYPPEQLKEIAAQLDKNAASEKAYADAIAKADVAFKAREWENATANYQSAVNIKEKEQYPKDKIKEIESILANEQKVNEDYQAAIASADESFGEKDYDNAKVNYKKAAALKSFEQYPQDKLKEIDDLLSDLAAKEKGYKDAIAEADTQFGVKDYQKSIDNYKKALGFKPEESYPQKKIEEAENLLAGLKQLQADYDKFIADGDAGFSGKNYEEAKTNYEEASKLFENKPYPKEKIAEIDAILNAANKLDEDYNAAIAKGDKAFDSEKYEPAKIAFEQALALKSEEDYPKDKLAEIASLLKELAEKKANDEANALAQKEIDDKYNALIIKADNAFGNKNYDKAKEDYISALVVKEEEQYPKDKLEEIGEILAGLELKKEEDAATAQAQKELDEKYNAFITSADKAFNNKEYDGAAEDYTEASDVKPSEQYPKDRLKEIEDILAALEMKKEEDELAAESELKKREYFEALIAEADGELSSENYTEAEAKYTQALGVIPGEKYPKDKLQEIKDILAKNKADNENANLAQKELDEKYNKLVKEGDSAFDTKNYAVAKSKYIAALNVKSDEDYPQDQLDKIEGILAEIAKNEEAIVVTNNALKQKQEQYNAFIKIADKDLVGKRYTKAISNYEQALGLMPDKTYPKQKIEEINLILAEIAAKEKNEKNAVLAEKEKRARYDKFIYDGDRGMRTKEYKKAQGKFNAALNLYPDEKYPSIKLAEILELLKVKPEEPVVAVTNKTSGSRAKINDAKEKEIEAKMAALLSKKNAAKAKKLKKDQDHYEHQEEIRISSGISRTKEAGDQLDRYTDDIIAQTERGNKYHLKNNEVLVATTALLEKAEKNRIKDASKRREEADEELADYVKEEIAFKKEQEGLRNDKIDVHNEYVDNVMESQLVTIERGDKKREENRKDLEYLISETEKNEAKSKAKSLELEMDVHKYRADLAKEEEIRISAAINKTNKSDESLKKLASDITKQQEKKSNYYKLNVQELIKFKARIDKLENQRIERAEKARATNKKIKEKIEADYIKNTRKQDKRYYKDIKQLDKFKKVVLKQELANQKRANKKRTKSNRDIVKAKEKLGEVNKSQAKRYKEFKVKLDEERRVNDDFISDLQAMEQEKILLANAGLSNYYMGEKQSRQDELATKYAQGITEETTESGNSITITRTKVTGTQADVYQRIFYTWGGEFFYKNGVNITQSLWDKESIE